MSGEADRLEEAYWIARLRAKGYTVHAGPGTGGIPVEPEVALTRPSDDRHCVEALEGQAAAEPAPPATAPAPTVTHMTNESEEPYWVAGLRAKGWTVRVGTDPTPLPFEPEDHFGPPYNDAGNTLRSRLASVVRKLWNGGRLFKRRTVHP